ncbi:MAG: DUF2336 domain-containing protein [Alphaproteobacteria bacterium]|nr:DUF2336 domain-containing protein [Alphaproteobacteria bacterium]
MVGYANTMSRLQKNLPAMYVLAHKRDDESRLELATLLAEIFTTGEDRLSLREEEMVNELIDRLLSSQSPTVRRALLSKFANAHHMPRKIAREAANDDITVARDVLMNCESLTDEDLIEVVHVKGSTYAEAVATRRQINEAVADALVTTGDLKVMQLVAENMGAKLSPKAVDVLARSARFTAELRRPIMKRPELTEEVATRMYWWVSQELRREALKQFAIPAAQINAALSDTIEELLNQHKTDMNDDDVMGQIADWLAERQAVSVRILPQVLRLGHFRLFNILLARLSHLDLPMVDAIVNETGGRSLAVLCRGIGIDKSGFVSIFLLSRGSRPGEQIVHPRELSFAMAAFDRMSTNLAQDLLMTWKKNPSFLLNRQESDLALEA